MFFHARLYRVIKSARYYQSLNLISGIEGGKQPRCRIFFRARQLEHADRNSAIFVDLEGAEAITDGTTNGMKEMENQKREGQTGEYPRESRLRNRSRPRGTEFARSAGSGCCESAMESGQKRRASRGSDSVIKSPT